MVIARLSRRLIQLWEVTSSGAMEPNWTCPYESGCKATLRPGCACAYGRPPCRDCGAQAGSLHDDGCDMAKCLHTGQQRLACRAIGPLLGQEPHDCGKDWWAGYDRDEDQAAAYGLWCYCPPVGSPVPCGADHPDAIPNVTRLMRNGVWDRKKCYWVLLDGAPLALVLGAGCR
jgi:hypothetical protein